MTNAIPDFLPFQPIPSSDPELERALLTGLVMMNTTLRRSDVRTVVGELITTRRFLRGALCADAPFIEDSRGFEARTRDSGICFDADSLRTC